MVREATHKLRPRRVLPCSVWEGISFGDHVWKSSKEKAKFPEMERSHPASNVSSVLLSGKLGRAGRGLLLGAAMASPFATHLAVTTGRGVLAAAMLAMVQAGAAAVALPGLLGKERSRWAPLLVVAALAWGVGRLLGHGLLAAAGLSHLAVFGGLLILFGATLLPGRTPLVTRLAGRLDPGFHPGMAGYTRAVTFAWCLFFAGQLLASLLLLLFAPAAVWSLFVNVLDVAFVALMFLGEYGVRRLRFRGHRHVPLPALVRAVRSGGMRP